MIPWLDVDNCHFPDVSTALTEPNGLLAAGGNLKPQTLLAAYRQGIFPWYSAPDPILWWSPDPRTVLVPEQVHISRSMAKLLRHNPFTITCDTAFIQVMQGCAGVRNYTDQTWISANIIEAYYGLHKAGYAHSVEVWKNSELVGGLYGVAIGCMFYGESMFSHASNASKTGFIILCQALQQCGFQLIDCQVHTGHLESLGAHILSRSDFQASIRQLTLMQPKSSPWVMLNHHE